MQTPQFNELLAQFQATLNADSRLHACQAKMQSLETENDELIRQLKNINMAMHAGSVQKLQEQLQEQAKELADKNLEIQALEDKLAASQQESTRKSMKLLEQHAKELNNKNLVIGDLETRLSAADQRTVINEQLKVLQEEHVKKMKNKDLEIQTLQDKLAASHEQHAKELTNKDLVIKELPAAELQTVDKVMELTNENKRLSLGIQKLQKEKVFAEKRLQSLGVMLQEKLRQKEDVQKKKEEVVSKPTTQLHTELHTELGKLYMELQESKKPQEALMAQLAAKDMEIEYLMEQHKAKLAAKDSEIQNLKEMIQGGDEMNEKAVVADGQSE
ncbi:hypothetical protein GCK72_015899 [Caenorhabditis remanei]|uniref:Uncharacterized protein n=1 Tax=Caenorhabditis remanei TaxID=31234 RepID=A0A6A5GYR2_CAERE|nr:hypothetical protein GCK72_015899 [Caenorhabditis remanei]KAF1759432.1 hypothetical protein GCK72_015899 [Caenorhabditis remanei]